LSTEVGKLPVQQLECHSQVVAFEGRRASCEGKFEDEILDLWKNLQISSILKRLF
jgi:hypothetical protein